MPPTPEDIADRRLSLKLFLAILVTVLVAGGLVALLFGPALAQAVAPGLGLQTSALIAFGVSLVVILVMAIAGGDGLLGEIQFMILGFAGFFLIFWLMIAWIF